VGVCSLIERLGVTPVQKFCQVVRESPIDKMLLADLYQIPKGHGRNGWWDLTMAKDRTGNKTTISWG